MRQENKELFGDFLHCFLDLQSKEHGNYYGQWIDFEVEIADQDGKKCTNPSIYQELEKHIAWYGYKLTNDMIFTPT